MELKHKYYKGTAEEFKVWITELEQASKTDPDKKKIYDDIYGDIVYISEHIGDNPEELCCEKGAIYAHGAIIAGGGEDIVWADASTDVKPEPTV